MSFGKAKIRRFNDMRSDSPGPAAYNPTIQDKIKGYAPLKAKRFTDNKTGVRVRPSNVKPKQISRRDPKPVISSTNTTKSQKNEQQTRTRISDGITTHIDVVESVIKKLQDKISSTMPSMNNKINDLSETWQEKKESMILGDKALERLITDNLNNILKEMSELLSESQRGNFQEMECLQDINA